ncbi:MAG: hypothetical protein RI885_1143 [Actinomycetota bacterium]
MTTIEPPEAVFDATTLVAEDLLLLLFSPTSGTIRGEGTTLFTVLAGAVLVDLALADRVSLEDRGRMRGSRVTVKGTAPTDPILRRAWERIDGRPLEVGSVIHSIGPYLREPILDRLVQNGHLRRVKRRILGLIPTTMLADGTTSRRAELVAAVRPLLTDGAPANSRTAPLAALLSASDALPQFHPEIPWPGAVYTNGRRLQRGQWGAAAAGAVVAQTAAGVIAASFALNIALSIDDD